MEENARRKCPLCKIATGALGQIYTFDAPLVIGQEQDRSEGIRAHFAQLEMFLPLFDRSDLRKWVDISLCTYPHPHRPKDETYLSLMLAHRGQSHGLCMISIYERKGSFLEF
jgi:hypothetical protein